MRWLVVGAAGMLGTDLMRVLDQPGTTTVGIDLPAIDITSSDSVNAALDEHRPDVVVNVAAYTAVDKAESDEAIALRVNGDGPTNLARAVVDRRDLRLVHVSTDYVFAGDATTPYAEDAEPSPRTAYGRTKLAGERGVLSLLPDRSFVVRTAWLYGAHGPNFVSTMLRLEQQRDTLDVVDDQHGQPTWAHDLAVTLAHLGSSDAPPGIYHGTSGGETTWFDFAREIFRLSGADPERVRPTSSAAFVRPAPRPAYSVLGHDRWALTSVPPIGVWSEGLAGYLAGTKSS